MANYPSPCEKCESKDACTKFRVCQPWLTRYRYRQKQINAYAEKVLPVSSQTAVRQKKREKKVEKDQSPCLTCTRVKDPRNCGSLRCSEWREWYSDQWKRFNNYYKKYQEKKGTEEI